MKPFSLTMFSLLCAAISPLCADAMGNKHSKANANNKQMSTTQPMNQITPPANPMVTHGADPYITADFIWWRMQEDGLDYSFGGVSPAVGTDASKGYVHQPRFRYEPGFKVGFGLKFKHDGWDFYGNYTWLHTNFEDTEKTSHPSTNSSLLSNYQVIGAANAQGPAFAIIGDKAKAEWAMHLNVLDLELGRNYWISQWLTLRPHFGMKFSWNDQDYNVKYDGLSSTSPAASQLTNANIKLDNDLDQWAVGLRTGLDAAWYMWKKWCIFGEFAISAIWNDFDIKRKDTVQTATTEYVGLNIKRSSHSVTEVLELALGLRFETAFHNDDYLFMLQAGWEEQIWFDQNQFFFISDDSAKNLTFEGLTIKAGFDF
jgi:hypothetical protein